MELYLLPVKHKWLSIEPLMESLNGGECIEEKRLEGLKQAGIEFVVVGGWSNKADYKTYPVNPEWIEEIISACDKAGVKVWLKNNFDGLNCLLPHNALLSSGYLRQELPQIKQ